ncbi:UvrD-like helicase C-terminal domain-containing protein [Methylocapsa palsarum]|uniref:UvrD-like helicase C-terminal domain-containing protein n=1 Tax=Methylocapsa palsarum TaxID=1612308 RepID=A0A1I3Z1A2_9HYPH|nr:UvrD-like helicase C-terminal domain-containing protein [Methylocapsa palsarum]
MRCADEFEYRFGELDALLTAHAMTIHKSQESEYPAIVITLPTQHYTMLARNLAYTAVTRGKRLVVIGQRRAVVIAVKSWAGRHRWTKQEEWLKSPRRERAVTMPLWLQLTVLSYRGRAPSRNSATASTTKASRSCFAGFGPCPKTIPA